MKTFHFASEPAFASHPGLANRLIGLFVRSAAMGVSPGPVTTELDPASVRRLVGDLQRQGIAAGAGAGLAPLMQEGLAEWTWDAATTKALEHRLDQVAEALESSPAPVAEWPAMRRMCGDDLTATLLGISASSLLRYASGEREAPGAVIARLHWLAMVVSDLAGAYNDFGIRRWFDRPRAQLAGQSPRAYLGRDWDADGPAATQVRALAGTLSGAQPLSV